MQPPGVPRRVEEVTARWLTDALLATGALRQGAVTALVRTPFGEGLGLMSQVVRLDLTFAPGSSPRLPTRMVVKLAAQPGANRAMAVEYGLYEREVRFYSELAGDAGIRTPVAFVAIHDPTSGDMVLVLEDLSVPQVAATGTALSDAEVELIARDLAAFQARWWDGVGRARPDWIPTLDGSVWSTHQSMFRPAWAAFIASPQAERWPSFASFGALLVEAIPALQRRLSRPPVTLVHFDFRRSNLFITLDRGLPQVAVVDWQPLTVARGPYDLAYFLSQSVPTVQRRSLESDILSSYHATLQQHGVRGYDLGDLWDDYRLGVAYTSSYAVGTVLVDLANEAGREYAAGVLDRAAEAVEDLDARSLVERVAAC